MARYATILTSSGEVISIAQMEGGNKPMINKAGAEAYEVMEVGPGVKIGMVRGGKLEAADGFGFPEEHRVGGVRLASVKVPPEKPDRPMVRADEVK